MIERRVRAEPQRIAARSEARPVEVSLGEEQVQQALNRDSRERAMSRGNQLERAAIGGGGRAVARTEPPM